MATKTKAKKKSSSRKKGMKFGGIDVMKYLGMAGGIFADTKGLEAMTWFTDLDPKAKAGIKIALGEFAPKFIKPYAKGNDSLIDGAGVSLQVIGLKDLMSEFNIAGLGEDVMGDDDLEVELDGIDDIDEDDDEMNEGILAEDIMGEDDLTVVQGEEDLGVVQGDVDY